MNPRIAEIGRKSLQAETAHEKMAVMDELRELAGGVDPVMFLLGEIGGGLKGHLAINDHTWGLSADGMQLHDLKVIEISQQFGRESKGWLRVIPNFS